MSHMDSMPGEALVDVPATRMFAQHYGADVLGKLGIREIAPGQVCLTPALAGD